MRFFVAGSSPLPMSLPLPSYEGDGASTPPLTPGQLVVVEVVPASALDPGPRRPLYLEHVPAGFPSPADDYVENRLNLHELVEADSPSCFFLRVRGESMTGDGIFDGDRIVVDRAEEPTNGSIVVASVDGELTLKRFMRVEVRGRERVRLLAANPEYPSIELTEGQELVVWGVVTFVFRDVRSRRKR